MLLASAAAACLFNSPAAAQNTEYMPGVEWPEPPVVTPGAHGGPPSDAIVLFDGHGLSAWEGTDNWKVEDGALVVGHGDIHTKQNFGDCQLHIEWSAPVPAHGEGQDRGNSGIFMQDRYEIQVLDSYHSQTYPEGQAGAVYKQTPPQVNAMRPPGEWNVYDIVWTAPRFNDDGSLASPAYVTALQNGVLILNHFEVLGTTPWWEAPKYETHGKAPIRLQDHGHPVRYRNIWVRELVPIEGRQVSEPHFINHDTGREWPASQGANPPAD
jgi:3-keto-disaccharide hydrolase